MRTNRVTSNIVKLSLPAVFLFLAGCSLFGSSPSEQSSAAAWKKDGSIVLSRVAPVPVLTESKGELLGFLPQKSRTADHWLAINKSTRTIEVMSGDQSLVSLKSEGVERLQPGRYQVIHKQKDPLWYAPNSYFTSRLLDVPAEGSRERYRKGALGDFVVYFSPDLPIHSSPVPSDEVGGVRLDGTDMPRLYYSLDIGSVVEVR